MAVAPLKAWMRKEDIFDNDLFAILTEQGINDPEEDFKTYTQSQWDELWRRGCVERAKELKDQKAKVRLEKKMKKLEKHWRKESGIKSTSIKKGGNKKGGGNKDKKKPDNSKQATNDALEKAPELKKYLQKNQCYFVDLLVVLVGSDIITEEDITKIESNSAFDEIYRQIRVLRAKELKDNTARMRMEKNMTKFEKLWRGKTGVKKTSVKKGGNKGNKKKDPKTKQNEELAGKGQKLKSWMKKNQIWENALYTELINNGIEDEDQLKDISEKKFDEIVRKVRVDRFSQLKDSAARNRADKLLVSFEKMWRKESGVKKTSIK